MRSDALPCGSFLWRLLSVCTLYALPNEMHLRCPFHQQNPLVHNSGDVAYSPKSHAAVLHACRAAKQQTRMLLVAAQPETLVRRYTAPLRPAVSEA